MLFGKKLDKAIQLADEMVQITASMQRNSEDMVKLLESWTSKHTDDKESKCLNQ